MAVSEAMVAACLRTVRAWVEEVRVGLWKRVIGSMDLGWFGVSWYTWKQGWWW